MYDSQNPVHTTLAAQALYVKLQKLNEDIQLQHSILNAQKETVLKSRQRIYFDQKAPSSPDAHAVHAHADTVVQHRAMVHKHYDLIRQHKQMVKEQGKHVQNLTSTLLNIQQETVVVDELMNTRITENKKNIKQPSSPTKEQKTSPNRNNDPTSPRRERRRSGTITTTEANSIINYSNDIKKIDNDNNIIHVSITSDDNNNKNMDQITSITLTTTSKSTISPSSNTTTSVSSISTTTITNNTATTTTTTTFIPYDTNSVPLPLSP